LTKPFFLWFTNNVSSSLEKSDSEIITLLFCVLPGTKKKITDKMLKFRITMDDKQLFIIQSCKK